jgi:hypothetical protein
MVDAPARRPLQGTSCPHPAGVGLIKPGYDPQLTNQDVAPLHRVLDVGRALRGRAIHYILGSLIGPLFGILIAGYYLAARQRIAVDAMYTLDPTGRYFYRGGFNPNAVITVVVTGVIAILLSLFTGIGDFGWFIGCGLGFATFALLEWGRPMITVPPADEEDVSDGTAASLP